MKTQVNFGNALESLKEGEKVQRVGWNGKGIYIEKQELYIYGVLNSDFLVIKGVDGTYNTWVPSISDLFANDWQVVD